MLNQNKILMLGGLIILGVVLYSILDDSSNVVKLDERIVSFEVDTNHPLAGEDLIFRILLIKINNMTDNDSEVKNNDSVEVDYELRVASNRETILQTTFEDERNFAFTVGQGQTIKGFDNNLIGMKVGEEKTVTIPANQAYGERNQSNILKEELPYSNFTKITEEILLGLNITVEDWINRTIVVDRGRGTSLKVVSID